MSKMSLFQRVACQHVSVQILSIESDDKRNFNLFRVFSVDDNDIRQNGLFERKGDSVQNIAKLETGKKHIANMLTYFKIAY
jgi:hypothetical protein